MASKSVTLKRKTDKAKQAFREYKEPFCESCGRTDRRLSVAHVIGEGRCGKIGRDDLRSNPDNFRLLCCCDSDSCHYIWDNKNEEQRRKLALYDNMIAYVEQEDPEGFKIKTLC